MAKPLTTLFSNHRQGIHFILLRFHAPPPEVDPEEMTPQAGKALQVDLR